MEEAKLRIFLRQLRSERVMVEATRSVSESPCIIQRPASERQSRTRSPLQGSPQTLQVAQLAAAVYCAPCRRRADLGLHKLVGQGVAVGARPSLMLGVHHRAQAVQSFRAKNTSESTHDSRPMPAGQRATDEASVERNGQYRKGDQQKACTCVLEQIRIPCKTERAQEYDRCCASQNGKGS